MSQPLDQGGKNMNCLDVLSDARKLYDEGQCDQALERLNALSPKNISCESLSLISRCYLKQEKYQESYDAAKKIEKLNPCFNDGILDLARAAAKLGLYKEAIAAWERYPHYRSLGKIATDELFELSLLCFSKAEYQYAYDCASKVLSLNSTHYKGNKILARSLFRLRNNDAALAAWKNYLKIFAPNAIERMSIPEIMEYADLLKIAGRSEEVLPALEEYAKKNVVKNTAFHKVLAIIYFDRKDYEKSLKHSLYAIKLNNNLHQVGMIAVKSFVLLDKGSKTPKEFKDWLKVDKNRKAAVISSIEKMVRDCHPVEDWEHAAHLLRKTLIIFPKHAILKFQLAAVLHRSGQTTQALEYFRGADVALFPRDYLCFVAICDLLILKCDFKEFVDFGVSLVEKKTYHVFFLSFFWKYFMRTSYIDEANSFFRELSRRTRDPLAYERYFLSMRRMGAIPALLRYTRYIRRRVLAHTRNEIRKESIWFSYKRLIRSKKRRQLLVYNLHQLLAIGQVKFVGKILKRIPAKSIRLSTRKELQFKIALMNCDFLEIGRLVEKYGARFAIKRNLAEKGQLDRFCAQRNFYVKHMGLPPKGIDYGVAEVQLILKGLEGTTGLAYDPVPGRVLYAINSMAMGGAERQVATIIRQLSVRGHYEGHGKPFLCLLKNGKDFAFNVDGANLVVPDDLDPKDLDDYGDAKPFLEEYSKFFRGKGGIPKFLELLFLIKKVRPEILHVRNTEFHTISVVCHLTGVPKPLFHLGNMYAAVERAWADDTFRLRYQRRAKILDYMFKRTKIEFIGNTEATVENWKQQLTIRDDGSRVIGNFLDADALGVKSDKRISELKAELGIPRKAFVVGTVFRFDPVKDPYLWVQIAVKILEQKPDIHFLLVGGGPMFKEVQKKVKRLGIQDHFHFPGVQKAELPNYYGMMDVFMLTSMTESFCNVLIEAAHFGVYTVCANIPGIRNTVAAGRTGWFVSRDDKDAYVDRVVKIYDQKKKTGSVRVPKKESAKLFSRFGIDALVEATLEAYGWIKESVKNTAKVSKGKKKAIKKKK